MRLTASRRQKNPWARQRQIRNRLKHKDDTSFTIEKLEPRQMLNATPIANFDLEYFTALNTALTINDVDDGVLDNDFDAEGATITASKVDDVDNGTLTLNSNGTFTYTPDTGFEGIDWFTYTVSDGTNTSEEATAAITVGDGLSPQLNGMERATDSLLHSGVLSLVQPLGGGLNLVYRNDTTPIALVPIEFMIATGTTLPDSITANLTIDGASSGDVEFDDTGLATGEAFRFVLRALTPTSSTGMYDWSVDVTLNYTGSSDTFTYTGTQAFVNRNTSEFGTGWWLDGLDRLYTSADGALLVNGNGTTLWFEKNGSTYEKAEGDLTFSTLTESGGVYTLTDKWGDKREFDSNGYLTEIKLLNNTVASYDFTYDASNRIDKITDEFGREYTFTYNATTGKLDSINDFFGRDSTLSFTGDLLTGITVADETQTGYTAPEWSFAYTDIGGRKYLSKVTDPASEDTEYFYNTASRRINKIRNADHTTQDPSEWLLYATVNEGLVWNATGNTLLKVSDVNARYVNELSKTFKFTSNHFGNLTSTTDALGAVTTFDFNPQGLLYRVTGADPDDAGSQTSPVTEFGYNLSGDLLIVVNPDDTTIKYEYHSTLHLITKFTNELGDYETYAYYSDGDLNTYTDFEGNVWTYTYDSHGNMLTETTPDPDGAGSQYSAIVTTYTYDTTYYNRLTKITWDNNDFQEFTYTSRDQVDVFTDELGNDTDYDYDPLDRVIKVTLPDPDGGGSQTSPVWEYDYGSNLLLSSVTDPLDNVTSYTYNSRHWLTKITLPDPDGAGSLTAPEIEYAYNKIGLLTTETLPEFNGVDITYTYDDNGQLTTYSGPVANQDYDYVYDKLGRITQLTDPSGRIIKAEYDDRSRITKIIDHDPDGGGPEVGPTTEYTYDDAGHITKVTDPLGRETSYAYSDNGWLTTITMPDPDSSGPDSAPIHTYDYDAIGRQSKYTDPGAREWKYEYNIHHQTTKVITPDPDGTGPMGGPLLPTETVYEYNAAGWLTKVTDAKDNDTTYAYDNLGRLTTLTLPDPDGAGSKTSPVYSYTYDAMGNLLTETDPLSNETTYTYDDLHRLLTITEEDPDNTGPLTAPVWTYEYNDRMLLDSVTNPESQETTYGYDSAGRMTTVTDPLSNVTTYTYDLMNRVTDITTPDPDGGGSLQASVTSYTFDIYSRLTEIEDANDGTTTIVYDAAGQMLSLEDASGNETFWAYDNLGRMSMETDELGNTRSYYYNEIDRLIRKVDREGRTTLYGYEGYDTLELWYEHTTAPYATVATTTQGGGGNDEVQTVELENTSEGTFRLAFEGQTTAPLDYDATAAEVETALEALEAIDNVSVSLSAGVYTITFLGNLADTDVMQLQADVLLDDDGTEVREIVMTYDELFRLIGITDDGGSSFDYTLDNLGRVTQIDENIRGLSDDLKLTFDYDAASNRTEMAVQLQTGQFPTDDYKNTYTYDNLNRLISILQEDQSGGNAVADKLVKYVYNGLGQFTYINRFENTTGTDPALRTKFTYDGAGRMSSMQHRDVDSASTSYELVHYDYTYDNMGRITQIDSTLDGISDYTYDAESQLTDADHAAGRTDESYSYDATGNRDSTGYTVGAKNRTTASSGYTYEYDKEGNRTKRINTSDDSYDVYTWDHRNRLVSVDFYDSNDTLLQTLDYEYDAFNRMSRRIYDDDAGGSNPAVDTFWAGFDGIHATLEFDDAGADDISHRYLWGPGADNLLADEVVTSTSSAGDIYWALGDQVGTIRDIAEWDSTGSEFVVANHREYDSFGNLVSETDDTVDLAFGFTGKWFEEETGYTHHLNRWYDANIGKWLSEDPIGFAGGDTNIARYVANAVTSMIDSNGLEGDTGGRAIGTLGAGQGWRESSNWFSLNGDLLMQTSAAGREQQVDEEFIQKVEDILDASKIPSLKYVKDDYEGGQAGNDCDDFCTMAHKVLTEKIDEEGVTIKILEIIWTNTIPLEGKEEEEGHTVLQIEYNGVTYLAEPQDGVVEPRPDNVKDFLDSRSIGGDYIPEKDELFRESKDVRPGKTYSTPKDYYDDHPEEPRPRTRSKDLRISNLQQLRDAGATESPGGVPVDQFDQLIKDIREGKK